MAKRKSALKKFAERAIEAVATPLFLGLIYLSAWTCRWKFVDCEGVEQALNDPNEGLILVTPHENVLSVLTLGLAGWPFHGKAVISNHGTAARVYPVIKAIGADIIQVDKHDATTNVNDEVKETLAANDFILITPDGPLGPPHKFDPGVWLLARRHRAKVVFLHGFWTRQVRMGTWDRQKVPMPFSTCYITGVSPFKVDKSFGGVRHEDILDGSADPSHPAVSIVDNVIAKTDRLERDVMGRNQ